MAAARVKLADIVDALDMLQPNWQSFLNRQTGEIVTLTDDGVIAADEAFDAETLDAEPFLALPDSVEVGEWSVMERFAQTRCDPEREALLDAIHGRGAFRRFKDTISRIGAEAHWHAFRDAALQQIARDWLEANGIEFEP